MPLSKIDSASLNSPIAAADLAYTGTLTGSTGVFNLGSGQVYKDASGNVGIGTSSPSRLLQLNATLPVLQLTNPTTGTTSNDGTLLYQNGANFTIEQQDSGYVSVITGGAERARITSSGNFGLGTAAPNARLDVHTTDAQYAGYYTFNSNGYGIGVRNNSGGSADLMFFFSPNYVGGISTNGTTTSYSSASDYRLKDDVQPMMGALAKVAALKPCTYKWKVDGSDGQGFIAHELQAVCPSAVSGEKDAVGADGKPKYQGVDVSFLVATLTAAIQEQQTLITALTARITALEAK